MRETADGMPRRPNILFIMTDQQRADSAGFARAASVPGSDTPNLDRLAAQGVTFENAYSASPVCVPSRTAILTGIFDGRLPRVDRGLALREGAWTIAHAMSHVGYETALFGKMHFKPIDAHHGFRRVRSCEHLEPTAGYGPGDLDDYQRWLTARGLGDPRPAGSGTFPYDEELHPSHWITDQAIEFLDGLRGSDPFFAMVSYTSPHEPLDPPARYQDMYPWAQEEIPADGFEVNDGLPAVFQGPFSPPADGPFTVQRVSALPAKNVKRTLAAIRALVRQIDDEVGRLLAHVSLEDTIVFFTSDHGGFYGHRGVMGKVPWLPFDDLARVPLFAVGAGVQGGRRVSAPVQNCDFAATCLEFAGLGPPAQLDTESLAGVLRGEAENAEREVFCALSLGWPMIRRANLKLLWHWTGVDLLYDLESDPGETVNVASEYPAAVRALRDAVIGRIQRPQLELFADPPPAARSSAQT